MRHYSPPNSPPYVPPDKPPRASSPECLPAKLQASPAASQTSLYSLCAQDEAYGRPRTRSPPRALTPGEVPSQPVRARGSTPGQQLQATMLEEAREQEAQRLEQLRKEQIARRYEVECESEDAKEARLEKKRRKKQKGPAGTAEDLLRKRVKQRHGRSRVGTFVDLLIEHGQGSLLAGWRMAIDPAGTGIASFADFCTSLPAVKYEGDAVDLWQEIDNAGLKKLTLARLDDKSAEALQDFQLFAMEHGGCFKLFEQIDDEGELSLVYDTFHAAMIQLGLPAEQSAIMLRGLDLSNRRSVAVEDLLWLEKDMAKRRKLVKLIRTHREEAVAQKMGFGSAPPSAACQFIYGYHRRMGIMSGKHWMHSHFAFETKEEKEKREKWEKMTDLERRQSVRKSRIEARRNSKGSNASRSSRRGSNASAAAKASALHLLAKREVKRPPWLQHLEHVVAEDLLEDPDVDEYGDTCEGANTFSQEWASEMLDKLEAIAVSELELPPVTENPDWEPLQPWRIKGQPRGMSMQTHAYTNRPGWQFHNEMKLRAQQRREQQAEDREQERLRLLEESFVFQSESTSPRRHRSEPRLGLGAASELGGGLSGGTLGFGSLTLTQPSLASSAGRTPLHAFGPPPFKLDIHAKPKPREWKSTSTASSRAMLEQPRRRVLMSSTQEAFLKYYGPGADLPRCPALPDL